MSSSEAFPTLSEPRREFCPVVGSWMRLESDVCVCFEFYQSGVRAFLLEFEIRLKVRFVSRFVLMWMIMTATEKQETETPQKNKKKTHCIPHFEP